MKEDEEIINREKLKPKKECSALVGVELSVEGNNIACLIINVVILYGSRPACSV